MTVTSRWTVRHGDTSRSDVWAVLDEDGGPVDLTAWTVLAQARESADSNVILLEWTLDHGVVIGSATVRLRSGRRVDTSTVRLVLDPADFDYVPHRWSGVFDVEIVLLDGQNKPVKRYTIVDDGHLEIVPDVSR